MSIPFTKVPKEENISNEILAATPVATPVDALLEDNLQTKRILEFCSSPKGILEIADMLGYTQKKSVRVYLKPLIEQGRLAMTLPDKPNNRCQKYVTIK